MLYTRLCATLLLVLLLAVGCKQEEEVPPITSVPPVELETPPEAASSMPDIITELPAEEAPEPEPLETIDFTEGEVEEVLTLDEEGYYSLGTPKELAAFSALAARPKQETAELKARLRESINMRGFDFRPIGSGEKPFDGTFDGAGFVLRNLTIRENHNASGTGLFGALGASAVVTEVHLVEANITGLASTGGIAGISAGTIRGCSIRGEVTALHENVGGLVGLLDGGTIEQSAANTSIRGSAAVGGLCGRIVGETARVQDAYSLGNVTLLPADPVTEDLLGGFVGDFEAGSIANAFSVTEVYTKLPVNIAGAFAGYAAGSISSCYYEQVSTANWKDISVLEADSTADLTPCTVAEITDRETFAGWDFDTVWGIEAGKNRGLPFLRIISG